MKTICTKSLVRFGSVSLLILTVLCSPWSQAHARRPDRRSRISLLPAERFNRPYQKDLLRNVKAKTGARILDDAGHVIGRVKGKSVNIQPKNDPIRIHGKLADYTWRHAGPKRDREPSGWILRGDVRPSALQRQAIKRGERQAAKSDRALAKQHLGDIAQLQFTGRKLPADIRVRKATPGARGDLRLGTWTQGGHRLDITHNVPNQPRGGAVAATLSGNEVFHRARVRSISQRLAHGDGKATWVFGFVKRAGARPNDRPGRRYGWALQSVHSRSHGTIRLLERANGKRK